MEKKLLYFMIILCFVCNTANSVLENVKFYLKLAAWWGWWTKAHESKLCKFLSSDINLVSWNESCLKYLYQGQRQILEIKDFLLG